MGLFHIQSDDRCNKFLQTCLGLYMCVHLLGSFNLLAVIKWDLYCILYIKNKTKKKLTAKNKKKTKKLRYESLESKPNSMKCTALRKSKKHSWKVYIQTCSDSNKEQTEWSWRDRPFSRFPWHRLGEPMKCSIVLKHPTTLEHHHLLPSISSLFFVVFFFCF